MLEVQISDHIEPLVGVLAGHLARPLEDPFAAEWVAVPSIGMRRWLAQRLAQELGTSVGSDGISANIGLPFPSELRRRVLAADAAAAGGPEVDPWDESRLVWAVLEVLSQDATAADPALGPLTRRARGGTLAGRAGALADLFDRYLLHRPGMVTAWLDGDDVDAAGAPIAAAQRWQPSLLRAVHRHIGRPAPPERFGDLLARVRSGDLPLDLPDRLFLFGLSTLPPDVGPLLHALAEHRDVHGLLLTPSVPLARDVAGRHRPARRGAPAPALSRRDLEASTSVRHPLLRSWGSSSRETAALLGAFRVDVRPVGAVGSQGSLFDEPAPVPEPGSVLGRLQADLRLDRPPPRGADGAHRLVEGDRSIQVHACTGATRQVEVLRDAILHLLAEQPDLTEADVVVLCPRIEAFSPVIQAVLGPSADLADGDGDAAGDRAPALRYRITDRSVRTEIPLLGVVAALLDLLPGRFTASAVADFLGLVPVRDRFRLTSDDLGLLDEWIEEAHVRWGLDGSHRQAWGLPAGFQANTWANGLDQVLMGTTVRADERTLAVGGVAPLPVGDGAAVPGARVADAVRTLSEVRRLAQGARPVAGWFALLAQAVDLLCSLPPSESWQRRRLDRVLSEALAASGADRGAPSEVRLTLADVRRLLADRLGGEAARASFGSGAVTFCSLSPLRSVPHAVVCVLGLDQEAMPRGVVSGDDLLAASPAAGDRDPRAESRQLLLEAVLAAQRTLVITCGAADVRTNAAVPPAVVLDELWDCLGQTCDLDPDGIRRRLQVLHPRQAFAASNFDDAGLGGAAPAGPWGFDPQACAGAEALRAREATGAADLLLAEPLPPVDDEPVVALDDLQSFLRKPVQVFVNRRLQLRLPTVDDEPSDDLPVELGNLERWRIGDTLLTGTLDGWDVDDLVPVLRAHGALQPGSIGDQQVDEFRTEIEEFRQAAADLGVPLVPDDQLAVDVELPDGRMLRGTVPVHVGSGAGPLRVRFSRSKPHHRVVLAVELLALTAARPGTRWRAVSLHRGDGKGKHGKVPTVLDLSVRGGDAERAALAVGALEELVQLRDLGLRLPLPLFDATSLQLFGDDARQARHAWGDETTGECADPYHRLAFGPLTFAELVSLRVDGASASDLADRLWGTVQGAVQDTADVVSGAGG